jgi:ketosteroid isomerase-like protein
MTKTALKTLTGAATALFLLSIQTVAAGTDRVRAEAYFNAISGGNAETIASFYADNAEFHWVGGPLAGVYTGKAQIKGVWERFTKAAGDINYKVLELSESQKGKRSTVTARVNFIGPKEVPVRFTMVYENGKIVNEVWEVDKPVIGYAKADTRPQGQAGAESGQREATAPQPEERDAPPQDERAETAAAIQEGASGPQEAPEQGDNASVADEANAKAPSAAGTPTPLPPAATATPPAPPKKAVAKPTPKKRYADKKSSPPEYGQGDEEADDGYEGYADSDDVYYGRRHRYYGGYGGYGRYGRHGGGYGGYGGY